MKLKEIFSIGDYKFWIKNDPHLNELEKSPFKWIWPGFIELTKKINLKDSGGIYIIRGPRQVGKTTLTKSIIQSFWKSFGSNERLNHSKSIFVQGDWIENFKELDELLRPYLDPKKDIQLIAIDEITFINEWQRALKGWYDEGLGRQIKFIITGSNSFDLKKQSELLPGRRGIGVDYELLPMSFKEFLKFCSRALSAINPSNAFEHYLISGGFPHAVREYINLKKTDSAQETYLRWIKGDFLKASRSDTLLKELFSALLKTSMLPVGYDDLREKSSMQSHNTVRDYVEFAEAAFVLSEVARIEMNKWTFFLRKNKKYYFRDPLIKRIAINWTSFRLDENQLTASLCESVVAEALLRKNTRFGYYHDKNKNEIDFLGPEFAIEVKSGKNLSDLGLILDINHKNKLVLSRNSSHCMVGHNTKTTRAIPIWDFLCDVDQYV